MKKMILLSLMFIALRLTGQQINPSEYAPMPLPEWESPVTTTGYEQNFISYDPVTGSETIDGSQPFYSDSLFQSPEKPFGIPHQISGEEEMQESDNFSSLFQVTRPSYYPYRTCVKLFITFRDGARFVGTGCMIGPCVVLTAGHCVYMRNHGGWATAITVVPAYTNNTAPYGEAFASVLYSWQGWTGSSNYDWDMGMIKLNFPIGNRTGTLGYGWNSNNNFFKTNGFYTNSYPAEYPYNGQRMYYSNGTFDETLTNRLYFNRLSYGGSSGGGTYHLNSNGNRYVYAVLSHRSGNKTGETRITRDKFNSINQVVNGSCYSNTAPVVTTGLQESSDLAFALMPNPARDRVKLVTEPVNERLSVKIYDLMGIVVTETFLEPGQPSATLQVAHLADGYYIVKVSNGSSNASRPLIKSGGAR